MWASDVPASDRVSVSWDTSGPDSRPDDRSTPEATDSNWRRTAGIGLGIVAVMAMAIATVVGLSGNDDDTADDDAALDEPAPATTLDTLPPSVTTTTEPAPEPEPEESAPVPAPGTGSGVGLGSQTEPLVSTIELPEPLASSPEPYEVVMVGTDGLVALSVPSGFVRATPIDGVGPFTFRTVVVAPDAALVLTPDGQTEPLIVRDDGAVLELDGFAENLSYAAGWSQIDEASSFHLGVWDPLDGEIRVVEITPDGEVGETAPAGVAGFTPTLVAPNGDYLVDDAGGIYAISPDGQGRRVTADRLIGAGSEYLVTRYCTEQYECGLATVAPDGTPGVRFPPLADDDFSFFGPSAAASPDGRSIVYTRRLAFSADPTTPPTDVVVTSNGSGVGVAEITPEFPFVSDQFGRAPDTWAPDSSGYFRGVSDFGDAESGGLVFITVDGEVIPVPGLTGAISGIGVRPVDEEFAPSAATAGFITTDDPDLVDAGATVGLVAVRGGTATHIDPAGGTRATWATPALGDGPDLALVDGAVIGISRTGSIATRLRYGEVVDVLSGVSPRIPRPRFASSTDRLTWRRVADENRYELVPITFHDIGGRTAWAQIDVDSRDVYGTDGDGRLVYLDDDGVRTAGPNDDRLVTTGELIAIGPTTALVSECDPDCSAAIVDVEGSRQQVAGPFAAAEPIAADGERLSDGTVSPDGEAFVFRSDDESGSRWLIFDTDAATEAEVPAPDLAQPIIWSPDSQRAYYVSGGRIQVWERGAFETRSLDSVGDVDAIVAVPLDFASGS